MAGIDCLCLCGCGCGCVGVHRNVPKRPQSPSGYSPKRRQVGRCCAATGALRAHFDGALSGHGMTWDFVVLCCISGRKARHTSSCACTGKHWRANSCPTTSTGGWTSFSASSSQARRQTERTTCSSTSPTKGASTAPQSTTRSCAVLRRYRSRVSARCRANCSGRHTFGG